MTNRIDKLRTQAVDYVEKQESLSKQQSDNAFDKGLVAELLTGISDDDVIESIEKHDVVLDSDANTIQENLSENAEMKTEAISDADEYLSILEDNLSKIKQINQASDLVKNTSAESSTKKRMSELQEIKKLLGEEAQLSTHESSVKTTSSERVETNDSDNTGLRDAAVGFIRGKQTRWISKVGGEGVWYKSLKFPDRAVSNNGNIEALFERYGYGKTSGKISEGTLDVRPEMMDFNERYKPEYEDASSFEEALLVVVQKAIVPILTPLCMRFHDYLEKRNFKKSIGKQQDD